MAGSARSSCPLNLSLTDTNERFRQSIGLLRLVVRADALLAKLYGAKGPIWHRGYFVEPLMNGARKSTACSCVWRATRHRPHHIRGRVLAPWRARVERGQRYAKGKSGELLFWDEGKLTRGRWRGSVGGAGLCTCRRWAADASHEKGTHRVSWCTPSARVAGKRRVHLELAKLLHAATHRQPRQRFRRAAIHHVVAGFRFRHC